MRRIEATELRDYLVKQADAAQRAVDYSAADAIRAIIADLFPGDPAGADPESRPGWMEKP